MAEGAKVILPGRCCFQTLRCSHAVDRGMAVEGMGGGCGALEVTKALSCIGAYKGLVVMKSESSEGLEEV